MYNTNLGRIIGPAISDPNKSSSSAAIIGDIISRVSSWDIDDVADAHQALDYFAHMEWLEMRAMKPK